MKNVSSAQVFLVALAAWVAFFPAACSRRAVPAGYQGYLEGEFVYVASPLAGRLETLAVAKGARVAAGGALFTLEHVAEMAMQREAAERLRAGQARLEDLKKGSRPSELATLEARLDQARSSADLSQRELTRLDALLKTGAATSSDFDRARFTHERNTGALAELGAQLATARLGARGDAVAAAEADVAAASAAKERADWSVAQKTQAAPADALVYDTLFRAGEFVTAGSPVVALLPPANLKVRFFVPEADFAALRVGEAVHVSLTGVALPDARIAFLSPKPEYTPPVLYNRDNRSKLVFMVEAVFAGDAARDLHPGQPVDVSLAK